MHTCVHEEVCVWSWLNQSWHFTLIESLSFASLLPLWLEDCVAKKICLQQIVHWSIHAHTNTSNFGCKCEHHASTPIHFTVFYVPVKLAKNFADRPRIWSVPVQHIVRNNRVTCMQHRRIRINFSEIFSAFSLTKRHLLSGKQIIMFIFSNFSMVLWHTSSVLDLNFHRKCESHFVVLGNWKSVSSHHLCSFSLVCVHWSLFCV